MAQDKALLRLTDHGFYCEAGDFFIDPWRPVPRAVVTHAHGDHLSPGCGAYLTARPGERVFRARVGEGARMVTLPYGEILQVKDVLLSFHPAGHILGSAQVRIEHQGQVWVVSGDYKTDPDPTCEPFELVKCETFVSEATFALPVFRWPRQEEVLAEINRWWGENQQAGRASLLYAYALGKAQHILAGVDPSIGPIYAHGAVERFNQAYRQAGVKLPPTARPTQVKGADWSRALILAPPSARGSTWVRRFGEQSSGFASGWMRIRGMRRRRAIDRGFVLSDHADWAGLMGTIEATGANQIWATHGYVPVLVRYLRERGVAAEGFATRYTDEEGEAGDAAAEAAGEAAEEAGEE